MIIAVFSLGQFVSSNLEVLKKGFEDELAGWGKTTTGDEVWQWMLPNLAPLRLGGELDAFRVAFNRHFDVDLPFEQFEHIFKSMSTIHETKLNEIASFEDYLQAQENLKVILVSHTNHTHLNYILEQIKTTVPEARLGVVYPSCSLSESQRLLFAPSMFSQCVEHRDTLLFSLKQLNLDPQDLHVVSFLNTIPNLDSRFEELLDAERFVYADPGKQLEHVKDFLEEYSLVHHNRSLSFG